MSDHIENENNIENIEYESIKGNSTRVKRRGVISLAYW